MNRLLYWFAVVIALATVASGAVQMFRPGFVLAMVGGESGPTSSHFFGIIGMFMVLFGGLLFQGLLSGSPPALFWAGVQKLGAAVAVGLGILNGLFAPLAWAVAGFDLVSGLVVGWLWYESLHD